MKKKQPFICVIFLLAGYFSFSQTITLNIISPTPNQVVTDSVLKITVQGSPSTYEIFSIIVTVQDRQTQLVFDPVSGYFKGTLLLTGLPQGTPLAAQVVAIDVLNNQKTASVSFIFNYDGPPVLVVDSPKNWSIANPLLHIKAKTIDNGNCTINISMYTDTYYETTPPFYSKNFINSVDSLFDLSSREEGSSVYILIKANDGKGQLAKTDTSYASVESSPYLKKVITVDGFIQDFNFNKVLFNNYKGKLSTVADVFQMESRPQASRPVQTTSATVGSLAAKQFLTPKGAIFSGNQITELYNDSLYIQDRNTPTMRGYGLIASDNYALFRNGYGELRLRDFRNTATVVVGGVSGGEGFDITDDGIIVFDASGPVGNGNYIYRRINNTTTLIAPGYSPLTDGKNIVYKGTGGLVLFDGEKENVLVSGAYVDRGAGFQVNNNWVAYLKPGPSSINQVWLKDTLGNYSQKTFFGKNSTLDVLSPKGNLIATLGGKKKYFIRADNTQPMEICSSPGICYYRDSAFYIAIGSSLYKIYLVIAPDTLSNSAISVLKDSIYKFKIPDFAGNFKGPGNLMRIRLASPPVNGILRLNGDSIAVDSEITRSDLVNLSYTPNPGSVIADSIRWNGSNGINYTANNATMSVNIITPFYSIANGNWNAPATWVNNIVPPIGSDIIIRNKVIANVNVTCNSLTVRSPGGLVVNTGITVTIPK